jgi:hypothetical protein
VKNIKKERIEAGLVDSSINFPLKTVPSKIRLGYVVRNVSNERHVNSKGTLAKGTTINFERTIVKESTYSHNSKFGVKKG